MKLKKDENGRIILPSKQEMSELEKQEFLELAAALGILGFKMPPITEEEFADAMGFAGHIKKARELGHKAKEKYDELVKEKAI